MESFLAPAGMAWEGVALWDSAIPSSTVSLSQDVAVVQGLEGHHGSLGKEMPFPALPPIQRVCVHQCICLHSPLEAGDPTGV